MVTGDAGVQQGRQRVECDRAVVEQLDGDVHPPLVVRHEREPLGVVVVVVAVEHPAVPPLGRVRRPVGAVEPVVAGLDDAGLDHRERGVSRIQSHVVVPADEQAAAEALEPLDRLAPVAHVHRHVAEVEQRVVGADDLVMAPEEGVVHLAGRRERAVAVLDDVGVPEVVVGGDEAGHIGPSAAPGKGVSPPRRPVARNTTRWLFRAA
ncbi:hypothetical protein [Haloglomus litoreum]|uniref:hypothetical protein n=1 Tax=Haloglomus litoreum TaxID=3034026 RepID=UPI0023E76206|nr:hypothetical protein [Haloglomus sp. DT116]